MKRITDERDEQLLAKDVVARTDKKGKLETAVNEHQERRVDKPEAMARFTNSTSNSIHFEISQNVFISQVGIHSANIPLSNIIKNLWTCIVWRRVGVHAFTSAVLFEFRPCFVSYDPFICVTSFMSRSSERFQKIH